jgi:hypothetical protein
MLACLNAGIDDDAGILKAGQPKRPRDLIRTETERDRPLGAQLLSRL